MRIYNSPSTVQTQELNPNFKANLLKNEALNRVTNYAFENGQIEKLYTSIKNISAQDSKIGILVDIGEEKGKPYISFSKMIPRRKVKSPKNLSDFKVGKIKTFESNRHFNPLEFALSKIIKLGNDAPNNNMYKQIVLDKF